MSTIEFEQYKVDHLFLLVGGNTLPNYVAAKLLLHKGGTAYLVHSTGTFDEAKQLKTSLDSEFNVELRSLTNYESDAHHIQQEINKILKNINKGKIGLNYTGGTKAMSTHSYRTLFYEEIPDKTDKVYRRRKGIIFSYIDPRKLEICIDEQERLKVKPDTLELKLETLFQLHGLSLQKAPTQEPQLLELAQELVKVFASKGKVTQWFDWYDKIFCKEARNDNRKWKNKTDLAKLVIPLDKLPSSIIESFRKLQLLNGDDQLALIQVKKNNLFPEIEKFCKWLDGLWLEHYVLEQVKNIANNQLIKDYGLNFEIPLQGTKDGFEFDVAFTRGYQLFAISCTTASDEKQERSLCKSKLFEAYLRAKQMGGEEARVALVCCADQPDTLKAEIANTLSSNKIAVFGRADLLNLSDNIVQWIVNNDKEAK